MIGFIGMGLMGNPMVRRLLAAGREVQVWNRSADKCQPLQDAGAKVASSVAELVESCDLIMLCVTDTAAVESIVFGDRGIHSVAGASKILVDFSSIDPMATRDMAARLEQANGMHWIDCPVSGGVAGAEQGSLAMMAGGSADDLSKVQTVLADLGQRVTHMGPVGSGQVTKICNQILVSCNVQVMAEVMALAERSGVDATLLPQALAGGFADSIPLQLTGSRMAAREFEPVKWHVKTLQKDLGMARDLADRCQADLPVSDCVRDLMKQHAEQGYADSDPSTLIQMFQEK